MNYTGEEIRDHLRSANRFPPALDALFDLLRSDAPTHPRLKKEILSGSALNQADDEYLINAQRFSGGLQ